MVKAEIIKHSISYLNIPIITYVLEYPRYIHAELMTHRVFNRNSASSRAIPFLKFIKMINESPVMPIWTSEEKGMQGKVIDDKQLCSVIDKTWLEARDSAARYATKLGSLGVHKQNINRLIEPWMHIRVVLTATDFDNWFTLRDHKDAHPEIKKLAIAMKEALTTSNPRLLKSGEWHLPFINDNENFDIDTALKVSTARCARTSYNNFDGTNDISKDIELFNKLIVQEPLHASPAEHQAQVPSGNDLSHMGTKWAWFNEGWHFVKGKYVSNLRGWIQHRKIIEFRHDQLSRA